MKSFMALKKNNKIKIVVCIILIIMTLFSASVLSVILAILKKAPKTNFPSLNESFAQTSTIYDKDKQFIENIESTESRTLVHINKVPKNLQSAFLAVEDRKFYDHKGLDIRNILVSAKNNFASGSIVRGGSTISQQLVKNSYLSKEKSFTRKIQEAYLTLRMEKELSKEEILEAYLNRIDLGFGSYGIQTAAKNYFSKDVSELTLAESALLAGIVKSPAKYQPIYRIPSKDVSENTSHILGHMEINGLTMALIKNPKSFERQKLVLQVMEDGGYISKEEREKALEEKIAFRPFIPKPSPYSTYVSDYINDEAARELMRVYRITYAEAKEKVATGGLKIYSSLDPKLQKNLEELFKNFTKSYLSQAKNEGANFLSFSKDPYDNILDKNGQILFFYHPNLYDKNFNMKLPKSYYSFQKNKGLKIKKDVFLPKENGLECKDTYYINEDSCLMSFDMGAVHIEPEDYRLEGDYLFIPSSSLRKYPSLFSIDKDQLILSSEYIDFPQNPTLQPQATAIVIDNNSGAIRSFLGGTEVENPNKRLLNRLYSKRQPGGSLMPLSVYLPALENNERLGSVYDDVPQMTDGQIWPLDPKGQYQGYITLKKALALQKPSIAVRLLKAHGIPASLKALSKFSFYKSQDDSKDYLISPKENPTLNDFNLDSLALGNLKRGIDVPSLCQAYSSITNQGMERKIHLIEKIVDSNGHTLVENHPKQEKKKISAENAFLLRDALMDTPISKYLQKNMYGSVWALLGENKYNSDYHIIGSTPDYTLGLWIGADTPQLNLSKDTKTAQMLYKDLISPLNTEADFPAKPPSIIQVEISNKTGLLANQAARRNGSSEEIFYIKGTEPTEVTQNYSRKLVCSVSNMLANKYCPDETIVARYYFVRPKGYNPEDFGGIYPDDFRSAPSRYCNVHTEKWYQEQLEKDKEENKENNGEDNN